jgi:hypothetical protein
MAADRPTLAAVLRDRSRAEVAAFVAALYAARGAETRVDGAVAVVDGERYAVVSPGIRARLSTGGALSGADGSAGDRVDAVVVVDPDHAGGIADRYDVPVLTSRDLDRLARYGLDRTAADAVFRDSLDVDLGGVASPSRARHDGASSRSSPPRRVTDDDGPGDANNGRRLVAVGTAALAVVVLAVVVLVTTGPLVGGLGIADGASDESNAAAGTQDPDARTPDDGESNRAESGSDGASNGTDTLVLAPGLTADGISDPDALAYAHATTLANRSYTWELSYVEWDAPSSRDSRKATETVRVGSSRVYVSNVSHDGLPVTRGPIPGRPSYADGERHYRLTSGGIVNETIEHDGGLGRQESRAQRYLGVLLQGEETRIIRTVLGGPRLYVVDIRGADAPSVRNYTATAHVTPDGVVRYYSGSYCLVPRSGSSTSEICVSFSMRYTDVDETVVRPPPWYTAREPTSA